jgi:hypothetical protein
MSYVACAPINASNTHEETRQELSDVGAKAVLLRCSDEESDKELALQLAAVGITPIVVATAGQFCGICLSAIPFRGQCTPLTCILVPRYLTRPGAGSSSDPASCIVATTSGSHSVLMLSSLYELFIYHLWIMFIIITKLLLIGIVKLFIH